MTNSISLSVSKLQCVRDERILFDDLNFSLNAGQVLQIEGHNGSGKTSLLRILCGLSQPMEGQVLWRGEDIQNDYNAYWMQLNYVGHFQGVKGDLTPLENLAVARSLSTQPTDTPLEDALAQVGLRGFEDVPARALSAGQQRRVALARLLVKQADAWILDEPFTALDKKGIAWVEGQLAQHADKGGLVVLTSHHPVAYEQTIRIRLDEP
jgi:heme exporter protein A